MNESLALAAGSANGFIKGKNCNRCKRIHELLSLAFKILHFQSCFEKIPNSEDVSDIIPSELNIIKKNQDSDSHEFSKELLNILSGLKNYWNRRLSGKTVWDTWKNSSVFDEICRNDSSIHDFSRSVRPSDFNKKTYVSSIPKITIVFALNQPN